MNPQNLKKNTERTPSERSELARKAGKASGEKRRKNKTMRETLTAALCIVDPESRKTQKELVAVAMIDEAKAGNVRAAETICKILGEYEEKVTAEVTTTDKSRPLSVAEAKKFLQDLENEI